MHHFSVSWHINPLKFSNWNITIYVLDKKSPWCKIFQTFQCSNESSPNFLCHFWNHKVRVYWNSASLFIVMKDDSCIFLAQASYTLDKNSPSKWNFWTLQRLGGLKFTICEITSHFFFKISIIPQYHERWLICTFLAKTLYDFYNKSSSKCKISDFFGCSGKNSPNLYFDRLLLLKVYKISAEKVQRSYVSWYWKSDVKFEEKLICCFKNEKNLVDFDLSTQFFKSCTVICPFCAKYITFDHKKSRGVIFNDTAESCKIWRKTGL